MSITKETFANAITGREYGSELTRDEIDAAKDLGLVVVYGSSDDTADFNGAFSEAILCYEEGDINFTKSGHFPDEDEMESLSGLSQTYEFPMPSFNKIRALWDEDVNSWTYKTDIPHATFEVVRDGKRCCMGIVFSVNDLK